MKKDAMTGITAAQAMTLPVRSPSVGVLLAGSQEEDIEMDGADFALRKREATFEGPAALCRGTRLEIYSEWPAPTMPAGCRRAHLCVNRVSKNPFLTSRCFFAWTVAQKLSTWLSLSSRTGRCLCLSRLHFPIAKRILAALIFLGVLGCKIPRKSQRGLLRA
jgi:hypothetical protein